MPPLAGLPFRRLCGLVCLVLAVAACRRAPVLNPRAPLDPADWTAFKGHFLRPEGRVADNLNGNVSHSEGQGAAMLLADAYHDRAAFDRLWNWTRANLQTRPEDKLLCARWQPDPADPGNGRASDANNATEGDLLVAWALTRAGTRWKEPAYSEAALALCRDVRRLLLRPSPFGPVLLPAVAGFERPPAPPDRPAGTLVLQPSDWVFPAFPELYRLDPDAAWPGLQQSGSALLRAARFGPRELPADRVESVAGTPLFAADKSMGIRPFGEPPAFGGPAVRVPLYLLWSGRDPNDELLAPFNRFWGRYESPERAPAAVNVVTGQPLGTEGGTAGAALVARWVLQLPEATGPAARATPNPTDGYASSVLMLLTRVGQSETGR